MLLTKMLRPPPALPTIMMNPKSRKHEIERQDILEQILDFLCSSIGSLTNPSKIANTLKSKNAAGVSPNTIQAYIGHLEDAFLFSAALSDEETCRLILEMILQQPLPRVTVQAERERIQSTQAQPVSSV